MERTIITAVGRDGKGIIASICTYLADNGINILDISQTLVQDFFNMMMIADFKECTKPFDTVVSELGAMADRLGIQIKCQREDIFDMMHRI